MRLHGQYRTAILNLLELCKKWGESTRIVALCTRALELDPYEERLYLEKIVALETLGRHEEAQDLARRGSAMGCLHHTIEPGRAGSAYRQMRQADRNMESEVSKLLSALPDTENTGPVSATLRRSRKFTAYSAACRPATVCRYSWRS